MLLHNQFEKRVRFQRKHLDLKDRKERFEHREETKSFWFSEKLLISTFEG